MQKGFLVYYDILDSLELLNNEDRGMVFLAMVRYAALGELPEGLSPGAAMLFSMIRTQIDRDAQKYQQICLARSKAGKKSAQASAEARAAAAAESALNAAFTGTALSSVVPPSF